MSRQFEHTSVFVIREKAEEELLNRYLASDGFEYKITENKVLS